MFYNDFNSSTVTAVSVLEMVNKPLWMGSEKSVKRFQVEATGEFPSKLFTLGEHRFTKAKILCSAHINLNEDFKSETQDNLLMGFLLTNPAKIPFQSTTLAGSRTPEVTPNSALENTAGFQSLKPWESAKLDRYMPKSRVRKQFLYDIC